MIMTIDEEDFERLCRETHENNMMLKWVVRAMYQHASHIEVDNTNDFIRNIIANMVSNQFTKRRK